ncbi:uncharacterized protein F4817DRAFT_348821 [Daldinia loculata]|uniref:uncharacterized protein n=1 Tax=Daldinia loculata TaxID=103429 RepID=UPI0020C48DCC|nr:uncharacterized protein F4817DRAFT_348821 [Daldinia loculata]KAI1643734.1 hypothetical protein F4817DRAFT_348821 [Daldinia loculata]
MTYTKQHYYQTPGHVIAAGMVLSLVDILAVMLRFMMRKKERQPLKPDDWLLLPATLLTTGVGICLVFGVSREAMGYREYPTSLENPSEIAIYQMSTSIKLEWSISLILPIALACTKVSFLLFYKRIFSISRRINWVLNGLIIFVVMWALAFFFATLFCCRVMLLFIWKPISEMSECKFFLDVLMAFCITGFTTDLAIIVLPIPLIWRLKLSSAQKYTASASFLLGSVTVASALARLIVSVGFVAEAADPSSDNILNITLYCYWGMVECSVGVFAACLPTLQLFFRRRTWQSVASRTRSLFSSRLRSASYSEYKDGIAIQVDRMVDVIKEKRGSSNLLDAPIAGQDPLKNNTYTYTMNQPTTIRETI